MSLVDNSSFRRFTLTAFNINQTRNSNLLKKYEKIMTYVCFLIRSFEMGKLEKTLAFKNVFVFE